MQIVQKTKTKKKALQFYNCDSLAIRPSQQMENLTPEVA